MGALFVGLAACGDSTPTALSSASLDSFTADVKPESVFPDIIALSSVNPEGITVGTGHTFYTGNLIAGSVHVGDLRTGVTVAEMQFAVGSAAAPTFVNDVVVTRTAAYFTDSRRAVLYRVSLGENGALVGGFDLLPLTGDFIQGGAV